MRPAAVLLTLLCSLPAVGSAAEFNLATFTCASYQNQILNPSATDHAEDAVNFAMWLFGYAVGKSGDHSIYSNGLTAFGNALDGQCRASPTMSLLDAIGSINPANANPMDLRELDCTTFESRHAEMVKSDADSARSIMMWLYGFSVGKSGGRVLDTGAVDDFDQALAKRCGQHAQSTLYDALTAVRMPKKAP